ncbi:hypothetical protein acdb102_13280 [Acidothermaceae bacterium B102]|nr:hypothetical protein acdb102_13280 [Acidothermaceae bacterium B102]
MGKPAHCDAALKAAPNVWVILSLLDVRQPGPDSRYAVSLPHLSVGRPDAKAAQLTNVDVAHEGHEGRYRRRRGRPSRQPVVVEVLELQDGFRTAHELFADLRRLGATIGLTTVYRHLNLLVEAGRADAVVMPAGEARFRICKPDEGAVSEQREQHHHQYLHCQSCGAAVEIEPPVLDEWAASVAEAAGYTHVSHTLELFGFCPDHEGEHTPAGAATH